MTRIVLLVIAAAFIIDLISCVYRWKFFKNSGADSLRFLSVADVIEILDKYHISHHEYHSEDKRTEVYMRIRAKAVSFKQLGEVVKKRIGEIYDDFDC